jgi:hypothetical protein
MTETHVISALRAKRAEISWQVADLERQLARCRASLANIDATIRLFAPSLDPETITPKRTYRRTRYFSRGELQRRCLDALRKADGSSPSSERVLAAAERRKCCPMTIPIKSDRYHIWDLHKLVNGKISFMIYIVSDRRQKMELWVPLIGLGFFFGICAIIIIGAEILGQNGTGGWMTIKSEAEWEKRASAFLKHKLQDCEVTYAELAKRLKKHGLKESQASIANKLKRGSFPATFFLAVLAALELDGVALEEI